MATLVSFEPSVRYSSAMLDVSRFSPFALTVSPTLPLSGSTVVTLGNPSKAINALEMASAIRSETKRSFIYIPPGTGNYTSRTPSTKGLLRTCRYRQYTPIRRCSRDARSIRAPSDRGAARNSHLEPVRSPKCAFFGSDAGTDRGTRSYQL